MLEYLVFLSDWVKEHTTTTDRRLGDYLQSHPLDYSSGFARNN
jgi:hemerythrin